MILFLSVLLIVYILNNGFEARSNRRERQRLQRHEQRLKELCRETIEVLERAKPHLKEGRGRGNIVPFSKKK